MVLFFLVAFSTLAYKTIYVYDDAGVGPESLQQAMHTFGEFLPTTPVKTLNAKAVKAGNWTKDALLFIMPGGADE